MIKVIDCYFDEQEIPVVRLECGSCQARLSVDESLFNSHVVCPSCELEFLVPNYEVRKKAPQASAESSSMVEPPADSNQQEDRLLDNKTIGVLLLDDLPKAAHFV